MDRTGGHHVKLNKLGTERKVLYVLSRMWELKRKRKDDLKVREEELQGIRREPGEGRREKEGRRKIDGHD